MNSMFSVHCPICNRENLVDNGDESDQTRPDVDAFRCWSCQKIFRFDEDGEELFEANEDDCEWLEDGQARTVSK